MSWLWYLIIGSLVFAAIYVKCKSWVDRDTKAQEKLDRLRKGGM